MSQDTIPLAHKISTKNPAVRLFPHDCPPNAAHQLHKKVHPNYDTVYYRGAYTEFMKVRSYCWISAQTAKAAITCPANVRGGLGNVVFPLYWYVKGKL